MSKLADISILYVEDEETVRQSVARSLSLVVDNIATAENGAAALEYLNTSPVDLIITDIRMPKMDGLSFVEKLRHEGIDIPVIITSAFNEIDYFQKAIDLKVDKFINKPIRISDLIEIVTKLADSIMAKRDLTSRQQELEHYRQAINETSYVMRIDADGRIIDMNQSLSSFLQPNADAPQPLSLESFLKADEASELLERTKTLKIYNKTTLLDHGGITYTMQITAFASFLKNDTVGEITVMLHDISPIVQEKEEIINRLYTDELTGLPNRQKLFYDLAKNESNAAMMIIDIEQFSNINYLYGYERGDEVLRQTAKVLQDFVTEGTLYRTDMDHFVILTHSLGHADREKAESFAAQIANRIEKHNYIVGNVISIDVGITIGASCAGETDLYTEASMALALAKETHKPFMCFADIEGIKERFETNLSIQRKIKTALETNKILNYYQPIVDAKGKLVKYEALIRMEDPEDSKRILSPYHFLHIARQSKNYSQLTKQVITTAFKDFGDGSAGVSINLTFDDIINPDITEYLEQQMHQHPNAQITLELLESEGLMNIQETIHFCHKMKRYGAKIAIDDFGSGYSNFVYFFDIPIDILKIDGSLVKRVHDYRGFLALETIVDFARLLGVKTVAEFVEDETVFEKLKKLGIDMYQGYYFAQPKPFDQLKK